MFTFTAVSGIGKAHAVGASVHSCSWVSHNFEIDNTVGISVDYRLWKQATFLLACAFLWSWRSLESGKHLVTNLLIYTIVEKWYRPCTKLYPQR